MLTRSLAHNNVYNLPDSKGLIDLKGVVPKTSSTLAERGEGLLPSQDDVIHNEVNRIMDGAAAL